MEYFENTNRTILGDFLRGVEAGNENVIDIKKAVLPDGKDAVVVCLGNRVLQPEPPKAPERAESPRRAHVFHAMGGFCAYLAQYKTPQTVIFADVGEQTFYAVLDDRASQGFEIVTMVPQLHPLGFPRPR